MTRSESEPLGCESGQPLRERQHGLGKRRRMLKGSIRGSLRDLIVYGGYRGRLRDLLGGR